MKKVERFSPTEEWSLDNETYEIFKNIYYLGDNIKDKIFRDISNDISDISMDISKILGMYYDQLDPQNKIMFKMLYLTLNRSIIQLHKYVKEKTDEITEYKSNEDARELYDDIYDSLEEDERLRQEEDDEEELEEEEEKLEKKERRKMYKKCKPCSNYGSRRS